ncbi:MAG: protein phosphatase CheZ [Deltaproteobacteria bacterium]|nr:protein phosphatase CheZ [Deltaproteobacteria bacterium]
MSSTANSELLTRIRAGLSSLTMFVDSARGGIESLESTVRISTEKFPEASGYLSNVTGDLESAANSIMTILEDLMNEQDKYPALLTALRQIITELPPDKGAKAASVIQELDSINTKTKKELMNIFAGMSFQDLSGQKIKKVMSALADVEKRIGELADSFGFGSSMRAGAAAKPAIPAAPVDQNAVDEILKGLGGKTAR